MMTEVKNFRSTDQRTYRNLKWFQTSSNTVFRPLKQKNSSFSDTPQVSSRVHRGRTQNLYSRQVVINGIRARSLVSSNASSRLFKSYASQQEANEVPPSYQASSVQSQLESAKPKTGSSLSSFRGGTVLGQIRKQILTQASEKNETFFQLPRLPQKDKPNSKFKHIKSRCFQSKLEFQLEPQPRPQQFQKFAKIPQRASSKDIQREVLRAKLANTQLSLKRDAEPQGQLTAGELSFLNSDRCRSRLSILNDLNSLLK